MTSASLPGTSLPGTSLPGSVVVIGCGLIGSSIGLALTSRAVVVHLEDRDPATVTTSASRGAGTPTPPVTDPEVVIVAVPPGAVAQVAGAALRRFPNATVTDVASVKALPLAQLRSSGADISRFVGGHPMAGREVSGPLGARGDLFTDRLWVLTPYPESEPQRVRAVESVITACGGVALQLSPEAHDHAVALTSHTPQLLAAVLAAQLAHASDDDIALVGQGLRDATRVAGSDPHLWAGILAANAAEVAVVIERVAADLDAVAAELRQLAPGSSPGPGSAIRSVLERGNAGRARLPDKHGGAALDYTTIPVVVDDRPGELGRLFAAAGRAGVNLEDVRIEHTVGRLTAVIELAVRPSAGDALRGAIAAGGWRVRG